jgi:hypothetical protein
MGKVRAALTALLGNVCFWEWHRPLQTSEKGAYRPLNKHVRKPASPWRLSNSQADYDTTLVQRQPVDCEFALRGSRHKMLFGSRPLSMRSPRPGWSGP